MATQVLFNRGFEDNVTAAEWSFRCRNRLVYRDPAQSHDGIQFLSANDVPKTFPNPSIYQDVYVGYDGTYKLEFGIWIRSAAPVPPDRRIILAIWHFWEGEPNPECVAKTDPLPASEEWKLYTVRGQGGGRYYRLEAYWHDDHPVNLSFDDAYCFVEKLSG